MPQKGDAFWCFGFVLFCFWCFGFALTVALCIFVLLCLIGGRCFL